jgi:hypothetical protein
MSKKSNVIIPALLIVSLNLAYASIVNDETTTPSYATSSAEARSLRLSVVKLPPRSWERNTYGQLKLLTLEELRIQAPIGGLGLSPSEAKRYYGNELQKLQQQGVIPSDHEYYTEKYFPYDGQDRPSYLGLSYLPGTCEDHFRYLISKRYRIAQEGKDPFFPFQTTGFSDAEKTHTWTVGPKVIISFPVDHENGRIIEFQLNDTRALVADDYTQTVKVKLNDTYIRDYVFDARRCLTHTITVTIPKELSGNVELTLETPHSTKSHVLYPDNDDPRQLGLALTSAEVCFDQARLWSSYMLDMFGDRVGIPILYRTLTPENIALLNVLEKNYHERWRDLFSIYRAEQIRTKKIESFPSFQEILDSFPVTDADRQSARELVQKHPQFLRAQNFGLPADAHERQALFKDPKTTFGFLTHPLIRATVNSARKIYDFTKPGDRLVIFGASPAFHGLALDLLNRDNSRRIIHFPFTGTVEDKRDGTVYAVDDKMDPSDAITRPRVEFLTHRLKTIGLLSQADLEVGTTYFVDHFGSASGPSFVVETILRHCLANAPGFVPDIQFISLKDMIISRTKGAEKTAKVVDHDALDGQTVMLSFPRRGRTFFKMPCHIMQDEEVLFGMNQKDSRLPIDLYGKDFASGWRIVPKFPLYAHSPEYEHILDIEKWRASVPEKLLLIEYFRTVAAEMIATP